MRKKLILVAVVSLLLAGVAALLLPTEGQLQTYVNNPRSYSVDNHAYFSYFLAWKARYGSERCLRALIEGSEALDGGYAVAHANSLKLAREHCDPATYKRLLNAATPVARHRARLSMPEF
ncbi:hypothetical protein IV102_29770 [bacterium]|nr:hypothetical protein [bacterium]